MWPANSALSSPPDRAKRSIRHPHPYWDLEIGLSLMDIKARHFNRAHVGDALTSSRQNNQLHPPPIRLLRLAYKSRCSVHRTYAVAIEGIQRPALPPILISALMDLPAPEDPVRSESSSAGVARQALHARGRLRGTRAGHQPETIGLRKYSVSHSMILIIYLLL